MEEVGFQTMKNSDIFQKAREVSKTFFSIEDVMFTHTKVTHCLQFLFHLIFP